MARKIRVRSILFLSLPPVIYMLSMTLYPIVTNIYISLSTYTLRGELVWVGPKNYRSIAEDPYIDRVIYNTLVYTILGLH